MIGLFKGTKCNHNLDRTKDATRSYPLRANGNHIKVDSSSEHACHIYHKL